MERSKVSQENYFNIVDIILYHYLTISFPSIDINMSKYSFDSELYMQQYHLLRRIAMMD